MQCGEPAGASLEVSSPTQTDEEYLSPQEEAMELGETPASGKRVHFKEPPSFRVGESQKLNIEWFFFKSRCINPPNFPPKQQLQLR